MSMYFCYYTFAANSCPKFMGEALDLLTAAQGKVFLDVFDVDILANNVGKILAADRPRFSTAHVNKHLNGEGSLGIDIYKDDHSDTSIGRAYFAPVRAFTTYDLDKQEFIEVKLKMEEPYNE